MGLVQHASNSDGTATTATITATFGANTTVGNCLIAAFCGSTGATTPTVSSVHIGGVADHWATADETTQATAALRTAIWTDQGCGQAATAVAATFSASSSMAIDAYEWAGIKTSGALDKVNAGNASASPWSSGATGVLTQAAEVAFGTVDAIAQSGTPTITAPGSPWTEETQLSFTNSPLAATQNHQSGFQQVSATTSLTYNGTVAGTNPFNCAVIITLELAATAAPFLPFQPSVPRRRPRPAVVLYPPRTAPAPAYPPARQLGPPVPRRRARPAVLFCPRVASAPAAPPPPGAPARQLGPPVPRRRARPAVVLCPRVAPAPAAPAGGRPAQGDYDKPWLKRHRVALQRRGPALDSLYGSEVSALVAAAYRASGRLADLEDAAAADAPAPEPVSAALPSAGEQPDRRLRRRAEPGFRGRRGNRAGRPVWTRNPVVPAAGGTFDHDRSQRLIDSYRLPRPGWRGTGKYPLPVAKRRQ